MLNGNGRSLNISAWNCRRGLLDKDNEATEKRLEIEHYIEENKLHALCIIESDLHGATSRVKRTNLLVPKPSMKDLESKVFQLSYLTAGILTDKQGL